MTDFIMIRKCCDGVKLVKRYFERAGQEVSVELCVVCRSDSVFLNYQKEVFLK